MRIIKFQTIEFLPCKTRFDFNSSRVSPARLKTLEAIAKIRDKENKILSTSFIILEWSLQRQKYETDVSNGYAPLTDEQEYTRGQQGIP